MGEFQIKFRHIDSGLKLFPATAQRLVERNLAGEFVVLRFKETLLGAIEVLLGGKDVQVGVLALTIAEGGEFKAFLLDAFALAALGTLADVVPLRDENRVLAQELALLEHRLKRLEDGDERPSGE